MNYDPDTIKEVMDRLREQNRKLTIENSELRDELWQVKRDLRNLESSMNHNCHSSIDLDSHDGTLGVFSHWLED